MAVKHDVFISYRRETGSELARNLHGALLQRRYRAFMDVEDLRSGPFNTALYAAIRNARDFVVVWTRGCFDRCVNEDDWFRSEIRCAIQSERNIVPIIHRDFQMPQRRDLPDEISAVIDYNGLNHHHDLWVASIDRLTLRLNSKPRTILGRFRELLPDEVKLEEPAADVSRDSAALPKPEDTAHRVLSPEAREDAKSRVREASRFDPEALDMLVEALHGDMSRISPVVERLVRKTATGRKVTVADIKRWRFYRKQAEWILQKPG